MAAAIVKLDGLRQKLATITTPAEGKALRDEIVAVQSYLKNRRAALTIQNEAALARHQVERRTGELLDQTPRVQGKRNGEDGLLAEVRRSGIALSVAYRWMRLAQVPESLLLRLAADCRDTGDELTGELVTAAVRRWLAGQTFETTGIERLGPPPATDVVGNVEFLLRIGVLEPRDLVGWAPEDVLDVRRFYDDYVSDERLEKAPGIADAPVTCNAAFLRSVVLRKILQRARAVFDECVASHRLRRDDPPAYWERHKAWINRDRPAVRSGPRRGAPPPRTNPHAETYQAAAEAFRKAASLFHAPLVVAAITVSLTDPKDPIAEETVPGLTLLDHIKDPPEPDGTHEPQPSPA